MIFVLGIPIEQLVFLGHHKVLMSLKRWRRPENDSYNYQQPKIDYKVTSLYEESAISI
jgi:hypothetical protein